MTADERRAALRAVLDGDVGAWNGLPDGCDADDFAALAGAPGQRREGRLSGMATPMLDFDGMPGPLRVFLDDDEHAYLAWADWEPPLDATGLVRAIGEPEARLEDVASRRPGTVQWVWGERGVTAYVADDGTIRGLALFMASSAEYYRAALGATEGPPYRPR